MEKNKIKAETQRNRKGVCFCSGMDRHKGKRQKLGLSSSMAINAPACPIPRPLHHCITGLRLIL